MIIYLLKLVLFLLSFYGCSIFVKSKLKIEKEFSYAFTAIIIVLILFLSSILNVLQIVAHLIHFLGIVNLIYNVFKSKKAFFKFDYKLLIIFIFVVYLTSLGLTFKFTSYDNFSHWALIVKQLFLHNSLPSFEYNIVDFTTYPPASALFIYHFGSLVGRTETSMIIGQLYFTFVFLTPLMIFMKNDKKALSGLLFVMFSLFILNCNIPLMDLMVDNILGTMGICSCCVAYYYRSDIRKSFVLLTVLSCGFIVLKNSGVLFVIFNALLLLISGLNKKEFKRALKCCVFMLLISFSVLLLWQQHLKMVYPGDTGVTTRHSISITNFCRTIMRNGTEGSKEVATKYYKNILNIKTDIILHYLIGINIFIIIGMVLSKKYKENIKLLIFINVLYFAYWICLGIMYILSMPYDEAIRLASYGRYMMSLMIVLFGIAYISIFELNYNRAIKNKIYIIISMALMVVLIYFNSFNSYKQLFDFSGNDHSEIDRIESFVKEYPIEEYKGRTYYFYFDCNFLTYYYYLLQYKYFDKNINLRCDIINTNEFEDGTIVITPDETRSLKEDKNAIELKENVFEINKQ